MSTDIFRKDSASESRYFLICSGGFSAGAALCVDIVEDGGKNHGQIVQFRQGVKPNAQYRVSALVKSDSADMAYVQVKLMKGKGEGTRFSTGTDEHGDKIVKSAAKLGRSPQEFVDEIITLVVCLL